MVKERTAVSLFSGAGGMDLGFVQAGFRVVAAVEMWPPACATLRRNFPDVKVVEGDVREQSTLAALREATGGKPIDVVFGGAPCQGWSSIGYNDPRDRRNRLVLDLIRLADALGARAFVLENVKGIRSLPLDGMISGADLVIHHAREAGYECKCRVLRADDFGVPQARERVVFVGVRGGKGCGAAYEFPPPTHGDGGGLLKRRTVWDAIGDLAEAPEDEALSHVFSRHSEQLRRRLRTTAPGQPFRTLPKHGVRPRADAAATTVRTDSMPHPTLDRMMTPRELARMQGFLDDFLLIGAGGGPAGVADALTLTGNAVPPPMACAIAKSLLRTLDALDATGASGDAKPAKPPAKPAKPPSPEAALRSVVNKVNATWRRYSAAANRADEFRLVVGRDLDTYMRQAREAALAEGRKRPTDDALLKAVARDPKCRVKHGALRNAWLYWVDYKAVLDSLGGAGTPPDVPPSHWDAVRHKALTAADRLALLVEAERDGLSRARLRRLVGERLADRGIGRPGAAPDAPLVEAGRRLAKAAGKAKALPAELAGASDVALAVMRKAGDDIADALAWARAVRRLREVGVEVGPDDLSAAMSEARAKRGGPGGKG